LLKPPFILASSKYQFKFGEVLKVPPPNGKVGYTGVKAFPS